MSKISNFVFLLGLAAIAAGLFGAIHNQLSYSVGPSYFHDFKFAQFEIDPANHGRFGAALVGWRASWWMGPLIGLPAFVIGLFVITRPQTYLAAGIGAIGLVIMVTVMAALSGLAFGLFWVTPDVAQDVPMPENVSDSIGFARAGLMHDMSYVGGGIGGLVAIWAMWMAKKREDRAYAA